MSDDKKTEVKTEDKKEEAKTFSIDTLIGLAKAAAAAAAQAAGFKSRVIEEDGVEAMVSMDYDTKRVNFSVSKGVVEKVKTG